MSMKELELAFAFIDSDMSEAEVWVSRSTGRSFVRSDLSGIDELPDDVEENDDYVQMPDRQELDLGTALVWEFVDREIPEARAKIERIFSCRGAYREYKNLLAGLELLEAWHSFEDERVTQALREWCEQEGIAIEG